MDDEERRLLTKEFATEIDFDLIGVIKTDRLQEM